MHFMKFEVIFILKYRVNLVAENVWKSMTSNASFATVEATNLGSNVCGHSSSREKRTT